MASSSKPSTSAEAASNEKCFIQKLKEVIQCTICYDFPPAPVFKCDNEHIVCGVCAEQMGPCGLCRGKLVRFIFGDKMLRELELMSRCNFYLAGCKTVIQCTEMKDHLKECYFRDIVCSEINNYSERTGQRPGSGCNEKIIPFNKFNEHLEKVHRSETLIGPKVKLWRYVDKNLKVAKFWRLVNISFDGHIFMWQVYVSADQFCTWMSIMGDEKDAAEYTCTLELMNPIPVPEVYQKKMFCQLNVYPYHNFKPGTFRKTSRRNQLFTVVPMTELIKHCAPGGGRERLQTNIRIAKKIYY